MNVPIRLLATSLAGRQVVEQRFLDSVLLGDNSVTAHAQSSF